MFDDVKSHFGWPDYLVFVIMLVSCSLVGIYFGFIEKKSKKGKVVDESDYLIGGRQMKTIPISMSLIARYIFIARTKIGEMSRTSCHMAYVSHACFACDL